MKDKIFSALILLVGLLITQNLFAQLNKPNPQQQLRTDVVYLASDYLEGRETGTKGEQLAAEYIAWRFAQLGLTPKGENDGYYHEFSFDFRPNPHATETIEKKGKNVVAMLDNGAKHTVVIGGHYDHLGYGGSGSLHAGEPAIHNGADDNASGIAALLYIAEQLKGDEQAKANNYLFMAFSAEELGLVGSKKWVNSPTIDLGTINYMFNMDMVGRLNEEKVLSVQGVGTSPVWKPALEDLRIGGIKIVMGESGVGPSDHTSFYLQDIPVLHFFTGQHREYHKPSDDVEQINFPGLQKVGDLMIALIKRVDAKGELEFAATKNEKQDRDAAAFKVTLGVMPDYVHSGKGMRVDSVIEDRVGAKAGMLNGDVVIRIGDIEVEDIYGYMEGLSKFKKGDKTTVLVKRGDKELELEVTF